MAAFTGWDISPNHGAMAAIDDEGRLVDWRWYNVSASACKIQIKDRKTSPMRSPHPNRPGCYWLPVDRSETNVETSLSKILPLAQIFGDWARVAAGLGTQLLVLEDYAYGAMGRGYQIAEASAIARLRILLEGVPLRLVEPTTVKMFTGAGGDADKDEVAAAVAKEWPLSRTDAWADSGLPTASVEDLHDAAAMANLARIEWGIRTGQVSLRALPPHQIRALNRATKAVPVNALGLEPFVAARRKL